MAKIDIETAILAHKFTCPYYSPQSESIGLNPPSHCGATTIWENPDCNGECWYLSHFKDLINKLAKTADKEAKK